MPPLCLRLRTDETGATSIEYGLIASLIAIAAITAMQNLGNELSTTFNGVKTTIEVANDTNQ